MRRGAKVCCGLLPAKNTRKIGIIKALEKLRRILIDECAPAGQHQARLEAVLPLRQLKEKLTKIEKIGLLWRFKLTSFTKAAQE